MEKCGKFWKNSRFSGRIWPDWGNTTRADMAGLGSIGLYIAIVNDLPIIGSTWGTDCFHQSATRVLADIPPTFVPCLREYPKVAGEFAPINIHHMRK